MRPFVFLPCMRVISFGVAPAQRHSQSSPPLGRSRRSTTETDLFLGYGDLYLAINALGLIEEGDEVGLEGSADAAAFDFLCF